MINFIVWCFALIKNYYFNYIEFLGDLGGSSEIIEGSFVGYFWLGIFELKFFYTTEINIFILNFFRKRKEFLVKNFLFRD